MSITTADEKGLYEDSMLTNTLEETGFLTPLADISGIEHVGWFNTAEPVFQIQSGSARKIAVEISDLAQNGELESAGLRGFIIPADLDISEVSDIFTESCVIVKIENWGDGCLPNNIIGQMSLIQDHISEREAEMSEKMRSYISDGTIELDTHAVWGWDYGQYQFVAWR